MSNRIRTADARDERPHCTGSGRPRLLHARSELRGGRQTLRQGHQPCRHRIAIAQPGRGRIGDPGEIVHRHRQRLRYVESCPVSHRVRQPIDYGFAEANTVYGKIGNQTVYQKTLSSLSPNDPRDTGPYTELPPLTSLSARCGNAGGNLSCKIVWQHCRIALPVQTP